MVSKQRAVIFWERQGLIEKSARRRHLLPGSPTGTHAARSAVADTDTAGVM